MTNRFLRLVLAFIIICSFILPSGITSLAKPIIDDKEEDYVPGEVLLKLKEGASIEAVLNRLNISPDSTERIHNTKVVVSKFKKDSKLEKDSGGWYWFLGKRYKEVDGISDKEIFQAAYDNMTSAEKALYRSYKITLPEGVDVEQAVAELKGDADVEYAQLNYLNKMYMVPNDPYYHSRASWAQGYDDLWGIKKMGCKDAWDISQGQGVVVAVIDSGIDYTHEDLATNIWVNPGEDINGNGIIDDNDFNGVDDDGNGFVDDIRGWNFSDDNNSPDDYYGHGTHCAGTIAAVGNNGIGVIGVAPKSKIMPVRIFPYAYDDVCASAIKYAADNGAKVLSNSWSSTMRNLTDPVVEDAIDYAYEKDCTIVFAAGNDDDDVAYYSPANYSKTITVAAIDHTDKKASFSNHGLLVDVAAPGVDILSLRAEGTDMYGDGSHIVGEKYYRANGTSMACPHIAGVAALIKSAYPEFSNEDIAKVLRSSVSTLGLSSTYFGSGIIDAEKALGVTRPITADATIGYPAYNEIIRNGSIPIHGETGNSYYTLYYSHKGFYADDWRPLPNCRTSGDDILAYINGDIVGDGRIYLKLMAFDTNGAVLSRETTFEISSFFVNASLHQGWPVEIGRKYYWNSVYTSPVAADLDGDGEKEIIVTSFQDIDKSTKEYKIYVWQQNGTLLDGWPKDTNAFVTSPAVADLDDDGDLEIISSSTYWYHNNGQPTIYNYRYIYAWHHNGEPVEGWPIIMCVEGLDGVSNVAVGDIDGDKDLEVVVSCGSRDVYAFHHNGALVSGWPISFPDGEDIKGSPTLGDFDNDGDSEIVINTAFVASRAGIYILSHDGAIINSWVCGGLGTPAIGDIDNDGDLEIVIAEDISCYDPGPPERYTVNTGVSAYHHDGTPVEGNWPYIFDDGQNVTYRNSYCASPSLADLDGGGDLEIIVADSFGKYEIVALNHTGTPLPGWPKYLFFNPFSVPIIADIDGDQYPEVIIRDVDLGNSEYFHAWHYDGIPVGGLKESTMLMPNTDRDQAPCLADIDNDGFLELITVYSIYKGGGTYPKVYVFDLPGVDDPSSSHWPMSQHDLRNTRCQILSPHIENIDPAKGKGGMQFHIYGKNFEGSKGRVLFSGYGNTEETKVRTWRDNYISCRIPTNLQPGDYKVNIVTSNGLHSNMVEFEYTTAIERTVLRGRVYERVKKAWWDRIRKWRRKKRKDNSYYYRPLIYAKIEVKTEEATEAVAFTDKNGSFRVRELNPGPYKVVASKEGYIPQSKKVHIRQGGINYLDFHVDKDGTSTLIGTIFEVRNNNNGGCSGSEYIPLADATIKIETEGARKEVTTDEDGNYRVERLRHGQYKISVSKRGYTSKTQDICLKPDITTRCNFYLTGALCIVAGTVYEGTSGTNSPISEAEVQITGNGINKRATTDENGTFSIIDVPTGEYDLTVSKRYYEPTTYERVRLEPGISENLYLYLSREKSSTLYGTVYGEGGSSGRRRWHRRRRSLGLANAKVSISGEDGDKAPFSVMTDRKGRFKLKKLPWGRYEVSVDKKGYTSASGNISLKPRRSLKRNYYLRK